MTSQSGSTDSETEEPGLVPYSFEPSDSNSSEVSSGSEDSDTDDERLTNLSW